MAIFQSTGIFGYLCSVLKTGKQDKDGRPIYVENFLSGFAGWGWRLWQTVAGFFRLEIDELVVRRTMTVFELLIQKIRAVKGAIGITQANGKIKTTTLTEDGTAYLITLEEKDMSFVEHDYLRCQTFDGQVKMYHVEIESVEGGVIRIPISEFDREDDANGDPQVINPPEPGDEIIQFGNSSYDVKYAGRHSAIYMHADEGGQPAIDVMFDIYEKSWEGCVKVRVGGDIPGTGGLKGFYCENGMIKCVATDGHTTYCLHPDGTAELGDGAAIFRPDKSGHIAGGAISWKWSEEKNSFICTMTDIALTWDNLDQDVKDQITGVGVNLVDVEYAQGDSSSVAPAAGWQTTAPAWVNGEYIWSRTKITYSNDTTSYTKAACISGGKGIKAIQEQYYLSSSSSTQTGGSWGTASPAWKDKWYIWTRSMTIYTDGSTMTTDPICVSGGKGETGVDGINGVDGLSILWKGDSATPPANPVKNWVYRDTDNGMVYIYNGSAWELMVADGSDGENGANGVDGWSVFITYHDSDAQPAAPTGNGTSNGWHTAPTANCVWMSQKVAASASSGSWGVPIRIKGNAGPQGVPGTSGVDGKVYYTWIRYANTSTGGGISNDPTDKAYIGFAYNKETGTESNVPSDYSWSLMKGTDGIPGAPGSDGKTLYTWVAYADNANGSGMYQVPNDNTKYIGIAVNKETTVEGTNPAEYTWSKFRGTDGKDGINGAAGVNGNDGVSLVYKGEFSSHPANPQNGWYYRNTADRKSYAYHGAWYVMTVDGSNGINGTDGKNGLDGINGKDGNDGLSVAWKGNSTTPPANPQKNWCYRDTDNGLVYIYNGTAWALMVADGTNGTDGANGSNGLSVFITYHDGEDQPATPTGNGAAGGWHTDATALVVWMSQKVAVDASSGEWGVPVRIKAKDGENGIDGTDANLLPWVEEYDENKTLINGEYMISPKIFSGTKRMENGVDLLTGIAMGKDCLTEPDGTKRTGIFALVDNEVVFELDPMTKKYLFRGRVEADEGVFRGKIETSIAGTRIEISPESNSIKMYDSDNSQVGAIEFEEETIAGVKSAQPLIRLNRKYKDRDGVISDYGEGLYTADSILIRTFVAHPDNEFWCVKLTPIHGLEFFTEGEAMAKIYPPR